MRQLLRWGLWLGRHAQVMSCDWRCGCWDCRLSSGCRMMWCRFCRMCGVRCRISWIFKPCFPWRSWWCWWLIRWSTWYSWLICGRNWYWACGAWCVGPIVEAEPARSGRMTEREWNCLRLEFSIRRQKSSIKHCANCGRLPIRGMRSKTYGTRSAFHGLACRCVELAIWPDLADYTLLEPWHNRRPNRRRSSPMRC